MKTTRNEELRNQAGMLTLGEHELQAVTGGGEQFFNAYYDVSTGSYTLVPEGQVYMGPGLLVGPARLKS
jgi:hypothetical protein